MIQETALNTGAVSWEVSADAGYYSAQTVDGPLCPGDGHLPRAGADSPRNGNPARAPGPHARQSVNQGPDAADAAHETGPTALRAADEDGGARVRAGQTGPRLPAVLTEGPGKGEPGVVDDLHRPQPAQAVPVWAPGPGMSMGAPAWPSALGVHISVESGVSFNEHR